MDDAAVARNVERIALPAVVLSLAVVVALLAVPLDAARDSGVVGAAGAVAVFGASSIPAKHPAVGAADPALFQWDFASGKLLTKIDRAHEQGIRNLDAAVSGDKLATCSFDKSVKLWSAAPHGLGGAEGQ